MFVSIEYWTIYRGPGFSRSYGLARPLLPPSLVSKLDRRHTGRLRKRKNLLTGEGGGRLGEEPNHTTARSLVLYKSFNTLCSSATHHGVQRRRWYINSSCLLVYHTLFPFSWGSPLDVAAVITTSWSILHFFRSRETVPWMLQLWSLPLGLSYTFSVLVRQSIRCCSCDHPGEELRHHPRHAPQQETQEHHL